MHAPGVPQAARAQGVGRVEALGAIKCEDKNVRYLLNTVGILFSYLHHISENKNNHHKHGVIYKRSKGKTILQSNTVQSKLHPALLQLPTRRLNESKRFSLQTKVRFRPDVDG